MAVLVGVSACGRHSRDVPDGTRCVVEADERWCAYETVKLHPGVLASRRVHFQTPVGEAPAEGWPVVLLFQGSFNPAAKFWEAKPDSPWGGWNQTATVQALLEAGYLVITPDAQSRGRTYWNTNVLPWSAAWGGSPDARLMTALFEELDAGTFGPADPERRAAAGISSGGYMTSRMALSYAGEFDALAIQSASWATCGGVVCSVPDALPDDHPPTLFLHGERDDIVPIGTMERYAEGLEDAGHTVRVVTDAEVGHAWLDVAPDEIVAWFDLHVR